MNQQQLLRIPKIEEPLKKNCALAQFFRFIEKMVRSETCERRQQLAVACAKKKALPLRKSLFLYKSNLE